MSDKILLIVGLGNPGSQYDKTRHNVGFACLDEINNKFDFSSLSEKFNSQIADKKYLDFKIKSVKPQSFMNLSGLPVRKIMDFYKIHIDDVIVIHDDIDLEFSKVKIKKAGGHAGHNGLKSLDEHIGKDYTRIRIGVGHPGHKGEVSSYVLGKFTKEEQIEIDRINYLIAENFPLIIEKKYDFFQTKIQG